MKGGVMMMMIVALGACALVIMGEENSAHTCGCADFSRDCADCDAGRCCGPFNYCGSTPAYCNICFYDICICYPEHCTLGQTQKLRYDNATDDGINTITATYDRNFTSTTASSLTSHDNMLLAWRSNYGRATICGSSSCASKHHDHDGQCLKVTSSENRKQAVVRIVQNQQYCSNPSNLVLDYDVFQHLHSSIGANGGNAKEDQLLVSYMYVHCMDY